MNVYLIAAPVGHEVRLDLISGRVLFLFVLYFAATTTWHPNRVEESHVDSATPNGDGAHNIGVAVGAADAAILGGRGTLLAFSPNFLDNLKVVVEESPIPLGNTRLQVGNSLGYSGGRELLCSQINGSNSLLPQNLSLPFRLGHRLGRVAISLH